MSHFYGYLKGNRGEATRCGSVKSGIRAHIRSYNNDVICELRNDFEDKDVLYISIPSGLRVIINDNHFDVDNFNKQ